MYRILIIDKKIYYLLGYYFDPVSTPYQKLTLKPLLEGDGISFCDYSLN
jgi:hypothetical protein